jgi:spore coat polysaccharide biosynthesis protein SpsF
MTVAVLQARMSSRRLPGKVLLPLEGQPMLARQIERIRRSHRIDHLIVATSVEANDDEVAALCREVGVDCFRGSLADVLGRYYLALQPFGRSVGVRLTADCPLTDPAVIDATIDWHVRGGFDYTTNALDRTFPVGLDVEVFQVACLEEAHREARSPYEREHVTPFMYARPERYQIGQYRNHQDLSHLRWTVDTAEDYAFVASVYAALYRRKPDFDSADVLALPSQVGTGGGR